MMDAASEQYLWAQAWEQHLAMIKPRRRKRKPPQRLPAVLPKNIVTRDMLAFLRDEIENILQRCESELREARRERSTVYDNNRMLGELQKMVRQLRRAIGLDPPDATALRVLTLENFEIWIRDVNQRFEALERTINTMRRRQ
jgi:hypothetical protein